MKLMTLNYNDSRTEETASITLSSLQKLSEMRH